MKIRRNHRVLITALIWLTAGPRIAAAAGDVQVNTYTTGDQRNPSVAMDADGDFVVVWRGDGSSGTDTDWSIQGQRFASDGSFAGDEFQVNTYTTYRQRFPQAAMDANGNFVVVWESAESTDILGYNIRGQRYSSDGSPVAGEFQVNTYTTYNQDNPSIAMEPDGNFIVVWRGASSGGTDPEQSIQGQRYASDGSTVSRNFQINTYTTSAQAFPDIAFGDDGDFIVVWASYGSGGDDSDGFSIQGRRFASNGAPVGEDFQINSLTLFHQIDPAVAFGDDDDFVVVWRGWADGSYGSIQGQRFASDGSFVGGEFQVNTYTTYTQWSPEVAVRPGGDFLVVWTSEGSNGPDTSSGSIQLQYYAADGSPVGGETLVNTVTGGGQSWPSIALDPDGDFVIAWGSQTSAGTDQYLGSIQKTPAKLIFADGFESGDTSAWNGRR